ncbi:MAG: lamin tail domain-containing protein [Ferruginibacter sp.]
MQKKLLICVLALVSTLYGRAQFTENFSDGDFTNNPAWVGGTADWIVNPSFQLQSNNSVVNSTYYLSTPSTMATAVQWDFFCSETFNPSSANYIDIFLMASASDLTQNSTTGYFVRMGGTDDEISLFRKDNGTITKIIDGANGILNSSNNDAVITVIRDAANQWQLTRTLNGTPAFTEGNVIDATYSGSAFFGVLVKQSTASFFQKHFIDDISVGPFVPDILPPILQTFTVTSATTVDVLFNEPVDIVSSQVVTNYVVDNGIGSPLTAVRDAGNTSLVHLTFASSFPNRVNLGIIVNAVKDLAGNAIVNGTGTFSYFIPIQYDVVIDELMADPTPLVGLPDIEWIELRNTTTFNIDLQGWRVGKPTGQSGPMLSYILKPDSFVIVCTSSAVAAMSVYGPVISVTSFPSLSNTGDLLYLRSPQGAIIHSVNYTDAWYQNELKKDGGWTLEMIDIHNPCSGISNWKASVDVKGGTPGKKNSVDGINADQGSPKLLRAYATDSVNIVLVFNESLDSSAASIAASYSISDGIGTPVTATPLSTLFDRVNLRLTGATALLRNKIYTVTVNGVSDCVGNTINTSNTARVGLYEHTDSFNIVINEILFNPKPTSNDYVEIYNRSSKILNLRNVYIANRNSTGTISSITQLSTEDYLLFPQDFMVITESKALVLHDYIANNPDAFIEIGSMPSFNDDESNVILLNEQGSIVDEVAYSDNWHFKLISNDEGVALERIDYDAPSQNEQNWHSAATNVGYGTPTYKNSQYRIDAGVQGEITVTPEIVSPDNDGTDDFVTIYYNFPEPGYLASITIFDAAGRQVGDLQKNALCGIKGYFRWNALGLNSQQLPVGIYIIYTEVFNLKGKTKKFKNVIVLARKLN